jgi:7-keto-8-aminopelargonate synthetase-like enzyme
MKLPENLNQKLENRKQSNALRQLPMQNNLIDFTSNDYIGFSKSEAVFELAHQYLIENKFIQNGATGSRLISGNHSLYGTTETFIAQFHDAESALIFNSGYDANVGFFSAVPQRNDVILYDELSHASIRDGIVLSNAKSYKFNHNDFEDLERLIIKFRSSQTQIPTIIYIVTETVFSMDGDCPNL